MISSEVGLTVLIALGLLLLVVPSAWWLYQQLRRVPPSVYSEFEKTFATMSQEMAAMRVDYGEEIRRLQQQVNTDHAEMRNLKIRVTELEIGIQVLSAQVRRLGGTPEWSSTPSTPPPPISELASTSSSPKPTTRQLVTQIARLYDLSELADLGLEFGLTENDLQGATVRDRARNLVLFVDRRGQLDDLIAIVREQRPDGGV